jgi:hypothetical protein
VKHTDEESNNLQLRLEKLTKKSQEIIEDFLNSKSVSSRRNYKSAIVRTLEHLNYKDISDLTIEDYDLAINIFDGQPTNLRYIKSFFRDIHYKELIKENDSFTLRFYQEEQASRNNKSNVSPKENKANTKYKPALTFEQILKLQEFLLLDFDDISKLKASFACYMMFCTDCSKEEFEKVIKVTDYHNGKIITSLGNEYIVPEKYEPLFESRVNNIYKGFDNIYKYLRLLEPIINYENLIPQVLINSRNQNKIMCSICGKKYFNLSQDWVCIENRLICKSCGEILKKNNNYKLTSLEEIKIDTENLVDDVDKSAVIFGYDKLKEKLLNKPIDFHKLQNFFNYIGKLGEAYVYKQEKLALRGTEYEDMVDDSPSLYPNIGYDIKSCTPEGEELYIEVKTEAKDKDNDFFLSDHEKRIGEQLKRQGKKYIIYRVHNILSKDESEVKIEKIEDLFSSPKYTLTVNSWKVSLN